MGYLLFVICYLLDLTLVEQAGKPVPKNGAKCKFVPTYRSILLGTLQEPCPYRVS